MSDAQVSLRQVRSSIGSKPKHRGTLRALGLGRIGDRRTLPDRPEIRGMIARVAHLVTVEAGAPPSTGGGRAKAGRPARRRAPDEREEDGT